VVGRPRPYSQEKITLSLDGLYGGKGREPSSMFVKRLELADGKYSEGPWRPAMLHVDTWKGSKNSSPAWPSTSEAGFPTHTTRPLTGSEPSPGTTSTTWPCVSEMLASILAPCAETSRVTASHSSHFLSVSTNMIRAIFAILRLDRRGTGWVKEATMFADYTRRR